MVFCTFRSWCTAIDYFRQISNHVIATAACEGEVVVFLILTKLHLYKLWYFLSNPISETFQIPFYTNGLDFLSSDIIDNAHSSGHKILYWVVNDPELMKKIFQLGVSGIITDRADLASKVLYELNMRKQKASDDVALVNTTESYFIPHTAPAELHTCVSVGCVLLKQVVANIWILPMLLILGVLLIVRKTNNPKGKQE